MTRAPVYRHEIDYGEDATWAAPAGAAKWLAWRKTALLSVMGDEPSVGYSQYGGDAPAWVEIGGYDIAAGEVIEFKDFVGANFESIVTATGARVPWTELVGLGGGLDSEAIQFTAYDADGRAMRIDRYAVPAPNSTDADTIAAQERRLLQTLLHSRERAAAQGGIRKLGAAEGSGDEFESLQLLDARIAATRARISWFEEAARGNTLPRAEYW